MGQVIASATMSLDGFIADDEHAVGDLFDWYGNGEVEVPTAGELPPFRVTAASAAYLTSWRATLGALLVGRTLFDLTDGWGGTHPLGVPVVVLTHSPPPGWHPPGAEHFHFVSGVEAAVAKAREVAGDGDVRVAAGTVAAQVLAAGLLDAAAVDLAPVLLGSGRRYFEGDGREPRALGDPTTVIAGRRVIHLVYPV